MPFVSARQYAQHRGVSHTAVQKAIRQGRIRTTPDGRIDVEPADRDWQRNTGPAATSHPALAPERTAPGSHPGPSYAQSRAVRELYMARLAKLDYEERTGKLVDAAEMAKAAFDDSRVVRDRLLTIPDRISSLIAAETDERRVHNLLTVEIREALMDLSNPRTYAVLASRSGVDYSASETASESSHAARGEPGGAVE